ncbi:zeta toxin family protein [Streptomyces sp. NPDC006516]|uniref:zeta toxin family protein n=1 Tax=Streptomyces sp. NPDC006516 TaxID=3154309 RepID=UPI0033B68F88
MVSRDDPDREALEALWTTWTTTPCFRPARAGPCCDPACSRRERRAPGPPGRGVWRRQAAHSHYAAALAVDIRTAGSKVRPDTSSWQAAVEEYVRNHGQDTVVESARANPDDFRASSEASCRSQHRIEAVALATPGALSQLGIIDRFLTETSVGTGGRFVTWANHDSCAKNMLTTLAVIDAEQLADRITVVTRDGTVLYDNELVDGAWRRRPAADKAVARGRSRAWTARETTVFQQEIALAEVRVHRDVPGEDERPAVVRDGRRDAALAVSPPHHPAPTVRPGRRLPPALTPRSTGGSSTS